MENSPKPVRRGRPKRGFVVKKSVKSEFEAEMTEPVVEFGEESSFSLDEALSELDSIAAKDSAPPPPPRKPMRPVMREEDPRVRAARRAAEVRDNNGGMDDGVDDFYIDQDSIPPGWSYEWKRKTVMGMEDPAYQTMLLRKGWEPVPADRHPSYMPSGGNYATIERKGMILMERPKELTDEAKGIEHKKARDAVRTRERQLNSAPDGQFGRDHAQVKPRINKSYETIPIPEE